MLAINSNGIPVTVLRVVLFYDDIIDCRLRDDKHDCVFFIYLLTLQCRYTLKYTYPYAYYMEGERKALVSLPVICHPA